MKCQILFTGKKSETYFNMSSAENFTPECLTLSSDYQIYLMLISRFRNALYIKKFALLRTTSVRKNIRINTT